MARRSQVSANASAVVLGAAVGVEDHAGDVAAADRCRHGDGVGGEGGGTMVVAESEPDEAPTVEVHHRGEVHGAFVGGDLFEVSAPFLVGRRRGEVPP